MAAETANDLPLAPAHMGDGLSREASDPLLTVEADRRASDRPSGSRWAR